MSNFFLWYFFNPNNKYIFPSEKIDTGIICLFFQLKNDTMARQTTRLIHIHNTSNWIISPDQFLKYNLWKLK